MTKVKNLLKPELTLGKLHIELMLSEFVEYQSQMLGMILLILGKDQISSRYTRTKSFV